MVEDTTVNVNDNDNDNDNDDSSTSMTKQDSTSTPPTGTAPDTVKDTIMSPLPPRPPATTTNTTTTTATTTQTMQPIETSISNEASSESNNNNNGRNIIQNDSILQADDVSFDGSSVSSSSKTSVSAGSYTYLKQVSLRGGMVEPPHQPHQQDQQQQQEEDSPPETIHIDDDDDDDVDNVDDAPAEEKIDIDIKELEVGNEQQQQQIPSTEHSDKDNIAIDSTVVEDPFSSIPTTPAIVLNDNNNNTNHNNIEETTTTTTTTAPNTQQTPPSESGSGSINLINTPIDPPLVVDEEGKTETNDIVDIIQENDNLTNIESFTTPVTTTISVTEPMTVPMTVPPPMKVEEEEEEEEEETIMDSNNTIQEDTTTIIEQTVDDDDDDDDMEEKIDTQVAVAVAVVESIKDPFETLSAENNVVMSDTTVAHVDIATTDDDDDDNNNNNNEINEEINQESIDNDNDNMSRPTTKSGDKEISTDQQLPSDPTYVSEDTSTNVVEIEDDGDGDNDDDNDGDNVDDNTDDDDDGFGDFGSCKADDDGKETTDSNSNSISIPQGTNIVTNKIDNTIVEDAANEDVDNIENEGEQQKAVMDMGGNSNSYTNTNDILNHNNSSEDLHIEEAEAIETTNDDHVDSKDDGSLENDQEVSISEPIVDNNMISNDNIAEEVIVNEDTVDKGVDDFGGDFGCFEEGVQNEEEETVTAEEAISENNPAVNENDIDNTGVKEDTNGEGDDEFGAFGDFEGVQNDEEEKPASSEVISENNPTMNANNTNNVEVKEENDGDDDDNDDNFGDFGSFEGVQNAIEEPATSEAISENNLVTNENDTDTAEVKGDMEGEDDDFGAFGDFEGVQNDEEEKPASSEVISETHPGTNENDTDNAVVKEDTDGEDDDDNDFGDFGSFEGVQNETEEPATSGPISENDPVANENDTDTAEVKEDTDEEDGDDDDFGDFGDFEGVQDEEEKPATAEAISENNLVVNENDTESGIANKVTNEEEDDDDDFGDFGDFEGGEDEKDEPSTVGQPASSAESATEKNMGTINDAIQVDDTAQIDDANPNDDNDDDDFGDFGDFEGVEDEKVVPTEKPVEDKIASVFQRAFKPYYESHNRQLKEGEEEAIEVVDVMSLRSILAKLTTENPSHIELPVTRDLIRNLFDHTNKMDIQSTVIVNSNQIIDCITAPVNNGTPVCLEERKGGVPDVVQIDLPLVDSLPESTRDKNNQPDESSFGDFKGDSFSEPEHIADASEVEPENDNVAVVEDNGDTTGPGSIQPTIVKIPTKPAKDTIVTNSDESIEVVSSEDDDDDFGDFGDFQMVEKDASESVEEEDPIVAADSEVFEPTFVHEATSNDQTIEEKYGDMNVDSEIEGGTRQIDESSDVFSNESNFGNFTDSTDVVVDSSTPAITDSGTSLTSVVNGDIHENIETDIFGLAQGAMGMNPSTSDMNSPEHTAFNDSKVDQGMGIAKPIFDHNASILNNDADFGSFNDALGSSPPVMIDSGATMSSSFPATANEVNCDDKADNGFFASIHSTMLSPNDDVNTDLSGSMQSISAINNDVNTANANAATDLFGSIQPIMGTTPSGENAETDMFGSFESTAANSTNQNIETDLFGSVQPMMAMQPTNINIVGSEFEVEQPITDVKTEIVEPINSLPSHDNNSDDDDDEGFGDFHDSTNALDSPTLATDLGTLKNIEADAEVDVFGSIQPPVLATDLGTSNTIEADAEVDVFGSIQPPIANTAADTFGSMKLPTIIGSTNDNVVSDVFGSIQTTMMTKSSNENVENDVFRSIDSPTVEVATKENNEADLFGSVQPAMVMQPTNDNVDGDLFNTEQPATNVEENMNALPSQDDNDSDDDEDFGDFHDPTNASDSPVLATDLGISNKIEANAEVDVFGSIQPQTSMNITNDFNNEKTETDVFGSIETNTQSVAINPTSINEMEYDVSGNEEKKVSEEDDFHVSSKQAQNNPTIDFNANDTVEKDIFGSIQPQMPLSMSMNVASENTGFDAFGSIQSTMTSILTPSSNPDIQMEERLKETMSSTAIAGISTEFSSTAQDNSITKNPSAEVINNFNEEALPEIAMNQNAGMDVFGSIQPNITNNHINDIQLDIFGSTQPIAKVDPVNDTINPNMYGNSLPASMSELPPSSMIIGASSFANLGTGVKMAASGDDDEFGDFHEPTAATSPKVELPNFGDPFSLAQPTSIDSGAINISKDDSDDDFGDFHDSAAALSASNAVSQQTFTGVAGLQENNLLHDTNANPLATMNNIGAPHPSFGTHHNPMAHTSVSMNNGSNIEGDSFGGFHSGPGLNGRVNELNSSVMGNTNPQKDAISDAFSVFD